MCVFSYKIGFTEFNLLGLNINMMIYNKGAVHPLTTTLALVVNLETAELFELKDLFRSWYRDDLNRIVIQKLKRMKAYSPCENGVEDKELQEATRSVESVLEAILQHDAKLCFSSIRDNGQFYLTDTSVVFVFPQYNIGPGSLGDVEIKVNYEELRGIFNPNGLTTAFPLAEGGPTLRCRGRCAIKPRGAPDLERS